MKKSFLLVVFAIAVMSSNGQMDVPAPGFNIRSSVSEVVGITSISIKYSRPGVKGREGKIWGNVVGWGFGTVNWVSGKNSSPWRAGANEGTVISFEHDVKIEGRDIKAGSYQLLMAMGQDSVVLIFSRQTEAWGSFYYRPEEDVLRMVVRPVALEKTVEWLKYEFVEHKEKSCVIAMQWEKLSVPFKVEVDVDKIVVDRLREQITSDKGFLSGNLSQASQYCFTRNLNMEEALSWARRAVTGQPLASTPYDSYRNLAYGYEKLNRLTQADSVMNVGLLVANLNQAVSYGRSLLPQKRIDRAHEVLSAAEKKFGDVFAVSNALAYVFSAKGDFPQALAYATKALAQANTAQQKATISANIEKLKLSKDIN